MSQALFLFVIDRASLFNDHRISGRPIRAKSKHFRTNWEHTCDSSPTDLMELILCRVFESSCLPTHNIVPHISWHDPPYRRTTKKYEYFPTMVVFRLLLRKFWIQTWFCNCLQYYHCLFHIVVECTPSIHDQRCWFSQIDFFIEYFPHRINECFVSFQQFNVIHIHR